MLDVVGRPVDERSLEDRHRGRRVVGMDERQPRLERAREGAGLEPEQPLEGGVPRRGAGGQVPSPRAEVAGAEGQDEVVGQLAGRR